jgi:hypothetical protein
MPVKFGRENKWYKISAGSDALFGGNPAFTVYLWEANQIPLPARHQIVAYCIDLYESQKRKRRIRIEMRTQEFKPQLVDPKPFFELILNTENQ